MLCLEHRTAVLKMNQVAENDKRALATWLSHAHNNLEQEAAELWQLYRQLFPEGYSITCTDFGLLKERCIALCSLLCVPASSAAVGFAGMLHRESFEIVQELKSCILQLDPKNLLRRDERCWC